MMVLRHLSASATTGPVSCRNENTGGGGGGVVGVGVGDEERVPIPMDLSKSKAGHPVEPSSEPVLPLNLNKHTYSNNNNINHHHGSPISIPVRPLSSSSRSSENIINNNNTITTNNNIDISAKTRNNIHKSDSPVNFSTRTNNSSSRSSPSSHHHHHHNQPTNQIIPNLVATTTTTTTQHHHHHLNNHPNSHHHNHHRHHHRRSRKADLRWRELSLVHGSNGDDDDNTFSSPDSGLHRDSPGEEDEVTSTKPLSPASNNNNNNNNRSRNWRSPSSTSTSSSSYLRKQSHPCLIPLSLIRAKYNHTNVSPDRFTSWDDEQMTADRVKSEREEGGNGGCGVVGNSNSGDNGGVVRRRGGDKIQTKRARLEEMVSQIKTTKDTRGRHYSGDDDTSSGGHVTSSDEVLDDGPTDLRNSSSSSLLYRNAAREKGMMYTFNSRKEKVVKEGLNLIKDSEDQFDEDDVDDEDARDDEEDDGNEPCNLAYPKSKSSSPRPLMMEGIDIEQWKKQAQQLKNNNSTSPFPLSPTDAAKLYGIDPETYQQQMMQLQLTSMLGDPSALLKALGSYPPWVYMGYYSQLLQSFQAQEILRQYAIQSTSNSPQQQQQPNNQGDKTPTLTMRSTVASSTNNNYHSQSSPLSPASVNEGTGGVDSDGGGSAVGPNTPSGLNGKRAPRAMTGRHVRTGTGASPSTLLTLRQKIEERQRVKAQQARQQEAALLHSQAKSNKNGNSKFSRKSGKK